MRILIVKLTSLGDVIHTLPAVTDAAKQVHNLDVHWLVEESFQAIPGWHPAVSKVITAATRRWRRQPTKFFSEILQLKRQLQEHEYDFVIDAQGLLKSAMLCRLASATKVGYDKKSIKESVASFLYDKTIAVDRNDHAINRTRLLFSSTLNYSLAPEIDYGIKPQQSKELTKDDYLVFLHGTTRASKEWPQANWQKLVELASLRGYKIKLLWGNEKEYQRACAIAQGKKNTQVCEKMNLNEILELLSAARGVVAVDTGLGHLAAALSAPCISIYLTTNSTLIGTIGRFQKHLQAEFESSFPLPEDNSYKGESGSVAGCYNPFTAEVVWQQLEELIAEKN